jgi:hypothetical protein
LLFPVPPGGLYVEVSDVVAAGDDPDAVESDATKADTAITLD